MIRAVLFDLDDTLLGNETDPFVKRYFALLSQYAEPKMPSDQFVATLLRASREMIYNDDLSRSNHDVFWQTFTEYSGTDAQEMQDFVVGFYENIFPKMQNLTERREVALPLVEYCFAQNWKVVVATNPMFPRMAIEERLRWAGVPVSEQNYDLVTTLENMHSTKPNVSYYEEILHRVGIEPETAVMVGDDWKNDIEPASQLGIRTYWITPNGDPAPDHTLIAGSGTLDDFFVWIQQFNKV